LLSFSFLPPPACVFDVLCGDDHDYGGGAFYELVAVMMMMMKKKKMMKSQI